MTKKMKERFKTWSIIGGAITVTIAVFVGGPQAVGAWEHYRPWVTLAELKPLYEGQARQEFRQAINRKNQLRDRQYDLDEKLVNTRDPAAKIRYERQQRELEEEKKQIEKELELMKKQ